MRQLTLVASLLISACVSTSDRGDFQPIYAPPQTEPDALTMEATPPEAPVTFRERCRPGENDAFGRPNEAQAEAGVLGTVPDAFGVPQDLRPYSRSGCEPAH